VLGPLLFTAYISPIGRVVCGFGVNHYTYADDTQLYVEMADGALLTGSRAASVVSLVSAQPPATERKQV